MQFENKSQFLRQHKILTQKFKMSEALLQNAGVHPRDIEVQFFPELYIPAHSLLCSEAQAIAFGYEKNGENPADLYLNYHLWMPFCIVGMADAISDFLEVVKTIPLADYWKLRDKVKANPAAQENLVQLIEGALTSLLSKRFVDNFEYENEIAFREIKTKYKDHYDSIVPNLTLLDQLMNSNYEIIQLCENHPQMSLWRVLLASQAPWFLFPANQNKKESV